MCKYIQFIISIERFQIEILCEKMNFKAFTSFLVVLFMVVSWSEVYGGKLCFSSNQFYFCVVFSNT